MSKVQKTTLKLLSAKNGRQLALINGIAHEFGFTESDLADSVEMNDSGNGLSHRTGLDLDDHTISEMALLLAENWEDDDVIQMIIGLTANELEDYKVEESEVSHAA